MGATMTITVYHLETSRSERIVWLMEELGLPYDLQVFPRETTGAAPHPLKEIHALGKAPVIRDGDLLLVDTSEQQIGEDGLYIFRATANIWRASSRNSSMAASP